jgi:hypothetical protein
VRYGGVIFFEECEEVFWSLFCIMLDGLDEVLFPLEAVGLPYAEEDKKEGSEEDKGGESFMGEEEGWH